MQHKITLAGEERVLFYDCATSADYIEQALNVPVIEAIDDARFNSRATLIAAGLVHAQPKLKIGELKQQISEYIAGGGDMFDLMLPVKRAIGESGIAGSRFTYEDNGKIVPLGKSRAAAV